MEQYRQVGEVVGSLKALMVLKHEISINQRQCCLLSDIMQLGFDIISEEIQHHLSLDEKNMKWKALELPLKELHRLFKEAECYIKHCMDVKNWWGKAISLHMNRDCVEFHIHNLLSCFPVVIEAIETAAGMSGADQDDMHRKKIALMHKYDHECKDPKFFQWKFGKQYLVPRDMCSRIETAWKEDRWLLLDKVEEKKITAVAKSEQKLADLLLRKLSDGDPSSKGKILSSKMLVEAQDYQVKRRLGSGLPAGGGHHLKEIHWLGESFAMRTFFGDISPLLPEIHSLLSLSHPNVLQYLCAFYDERRKEGFLVMELASKDLGSYMKEHSGPKNRIPFSIPVAVDVMLQIARGMEYLHSKNICHGDLNPSNVLLKPRAGTFQAKVSGFGIASIKSYATKSPKQAPLNPGSIWLAPEVLAELEHESQGKCTTIQREKADVYSFGMLCFELLNGKLPFEDGHLQGEKMVRNILAGERPLFSYPSPKYLVNLIKKCWQTNPNLRPSFLSICRILRYIKKNLVVIPDHGDPDAPPPPVDYFDMEGGYLRKFPSGDLAPVTMIPFQMFTYKLIEKEKISAKKWDLAQSPVFDDEQLAAMDDLFLVPGDQRSVCSDIIDNRSSGTGLDLRAAKSEIQDQDEFEFDQRSFTFESPLKRFSAPAADSTKSGSTKLTGNSESNEIQEKIKSLRPINEHKRSSSTSSTENKRLDDIPETTCETTTEPSIDKSDNPGKKPTLIKKLKAIKTKLIPETRKSESLLSSPASTKKPIFSSSPAQSPSRAPKKSAIPETPTSGLKRTLATGMKVMIPPFSPTSSPSRDFKKSGNSEARKTESLLLSPAARMKKTASPSSPSGHAKANPSPMASPVNPGLPSSRLGRQTSLPLSMSSQKTNIDHVQFM